MEPLILQIVFAVLAAFVLFGLSLVCGNGVAALLRLPETEAGLLPIQYLFGITAVSLLAWLALYGWVGPIGTALSIIGLAYAGRRPQVAWSHAGRAAIYGAPVACLLGLCIGLQFHGPSATLGGSPIGDQIWYAARTVFMVRDPTFTADFFADGYQINLLLGPRIPMVIGAALVRFGLADPFLFLAVTMLLFMGLWLAAMVDQALVGGFSPEAAVPAQRRTLLACVALIAVAPGYLYWVFESPPVGVVLPLGAIPAALLARNACSTRTLLAVAVTWVLFLCQSKLTAFGFIGPALVLPFFLIIGQRLGKHYAWAAIVGLAVLLAIICVMLVRGYQGYIGMIGLNSLHWYPSALGGNSPLVIILATLGTYASLAALVWRLEQKRSFRLGLLLPCACAIVMGIYIPTTALICFKTSLVFVAFTLLSNVRRVDTVNAILVALLVLAFLIEQSPAGGVRGLVAELMFAGMLLTPVLLNRVDTLSTLRSVRALLLAGPLALTLLALGATFFVAPLRNYVEHKVHWFYSPDTFGVYDAVNRLTPADALIFTDQTGAKIALQQGWNSYPAMGRRQTYISNWYEVPPLGIVASEVARRLEINRRVLSGQLPPDAAGLSRPYAGYYAVVGTDKPVLGPVLYANASFRLYRFAR